jgi:hypothetical protein
VDAKGDEMPEETEERKVEVPAGKWYIPPQFLDHIHNQAIKRQLTESEVITECIWYHKENAMT